MRFLDIRNIENLSSHTVWIFLELFTNYSIFNKFFLQKKGSGKITSWNQHWTYSNRAIYKSSKQVVNGLSRMTFLCLSKKKEIRIQVQLQHFSGDFWILFKYSIGKISTFSHILSKYQLPFTNHIFKTIFFYQFLIQS